MITRMKVSMDTAEDAKNRTLSLSARENPEN
jgi:hypothetical protein